MAARIGKGPVKVSPEKPRKGKERIEFPVVDLTTDADSASPDRQAEDPPEAPWRPAILDLVDEVKALRQEVALLHGLIRENRLGLELVTRAIDVVTEISRDNRKGWSAVVEIFESSPLISEGKMPTTTNIVFKGDKAAVAKAVKVKKVPAKRPVKKVRPVAKATRR